MARPSYFFRLLKNEKYKSANCIDLFQDIYYLKKRSESRLMVMRVDSLLPLDSGKESQRIVSRKDEWSLLISLTGEIGSLNRLFTFSR